MSTYSLEADGPLIPAADAARLFPPARRRIGPDGVPRPVPTHPSRIVRMMQHGVPRPDGTRLRLWGARTPGGWVTTVRAVEAFVAALAPGDAPAAPGTRPEGDRAGRALEALGFPVAGPSPARTDGPRRRSARGRTAR